MSRGKRTHSCAVLLLLCTVLVSRATNETKSSTCALKCEVPPGKTETKCTLMANPLKLNCSREVYSTILRNVTSLDLSNNQLTHVPFWMFPFFKSLIQLSLAQNNIKTIGPGAFEELENLSSLNLSFNNLGEWKVDPNRELQLINYLDVTGNKNWLPSEQFMLQLKNLTAIKGIKWTEYCNDCSLLKPKANVAVINWTAKSCWRYDLLIANRSWLWHEEIQYGNALDFIKVGFWPTCLCDEACYINQYLLPRERATNRVVLNALFSLYVAGSVALLVNIMVVLGIASRKSLRGDLAVFLVLNIAMCDVLIGLFSVLYARFNYHTMYTDSIHDKMEGKGENDFKSKLITLRKITGPILTCAVVSQVCCSFIMTLDKFLKVVFAMRPNIRFGRKTIMISLVLSWSFSVIFALLPVFEVGGMNYTSDRHVIPLPNDKYEDSNEKQKKVGIAAGTQILLVIIQLTSFVLYLPIFIVAKRSGANVGIKREATIAKKIALLVFTNLIFFTIPVLFSVLQYKIWLNVFQTVVMNSQDHTLAQYQWLRFVIFAFPLSCVSINSVLNPFLYALRHHKIKQQLGTILSRCMTVSNGCFVALGQRLHRPPLNTVQQENDLEMQQASSISGVFLFPDVRRTVSSRPRTFTDV